MRSINALRRASQPGKGAYGKTLPRKGLATQKAGIKKPAEPEFGGPKNLRTLEGLGGSLDFNGLEASGRLANVVAREALDTLSGLQEQGNHPATGQSGYSQERMTEVHAGEASGDTDPDEKIMAHDNFLTRRGLRGHPRPYVKEVSYKNRNSSTKISKRLDFFCKRQNTDINLIDNAFLTTPG
ncbi:hypothetical protein [Pseudomonas sp. PS02302]|uniref:hypothetical protein n=1 Tax=Pseudomonas sp. PS02302 TaxID=2991428 RepID=UPI00249A768D|nr:hypothetical protein [Pseudomonas sp. PS02302]